MENSRNAYDSLKLHFQVKISPMLPLRFNGYEDKFVQLHGIMKQMRPCTCLE